MGAKGSKTTEINTKDAQITAKYGRNNHIGYHIRIKRTCDLELPVGEILSLKYDHIENHKCCENTPLIDDDDRNDDRDRDDRGLIKVYSNKATISEDGVEGDFEYGCLVHIKQKIEENFNVIPGDNFNVKILGDRYLVTKKLYTGKIMMQKLNWAKADNFLNQIKRILPDAKILFVGEKEIFEHVYGTLVFYNPNWVANESYAFVINDRPVVVQWQGHGFKYVVVHEFHNYNSDPIVYSKDAHISTTMRSMMPKLDFGSYFSIDRENIIINKNNIKHSVVHKTPANIYCVGFRSRVFLDGCRKSKIVVGGYVILMSYRASSNKSVLLSNFRDKVVLNSENCRVTVFQGPDNDTFRRHSERLKTQTIPFHTVDIHEFENRQLLDLPDNEVSYPSTRRFRQRYKFDEKYKINIK